jgi:hypothetical protein
MGDRTSNRGDGRDVRAIGAHLVSSGDHTGLGSVCATRGCRAGKGGPFS